MNKLKIKDLEREIQEIKKRKEIQEKKKQKQKQKLIILKNGYNQIYNLKKEIELIKMNKFLNGFKDKIEQKVMTLIKERISNVLKNKFEKNIINKENKKITEFKNNIDKEKEKNNYEFNKIILTESNKDFINQNDKNDLNPKIVKKESESKNNFIYSINSKRKKINLPKVIRTEKKNEGTKIIQVKPYESQEIKSININFKEKTKIQQDEKNVQRNYSKPKTDKKRDSSVIFKNLDIRDSTSSSN